MDIGKKAKEIKKEVDDLADRAYLPDTCYINHGVWELAEHAKKLEKAAEELLDCVEKTILPHIKHEQDCSKEPCSCGYNEKVQEFQEYIKTIREMLND